MYDTKLPALPTLVTAMSTKSGRFLEKAHPRLIEALRDGTLSINRAFKWCSLPKGQQLERFIDNCMERATNETIHRYVKESRREVKALAVLDRLQLQEEQIPGSILIRIGRNKQTVISVGRDFIASLNSQEELKTL